MKNLLARFVKEEEGQDLIEYALLAAFIAVIAIAAVKTIGISVNAIFTNANSQLS